MREILQDIVKHTGSLGFIETVKITGTEEETRIESIDADKTVIIKGKLLSPLAEFKEEFGISNLGLLNNLVNFANYKDTNASVSVNYRKRNSKNVPEEIVFTDAQGQSDTFRLMSAELVPDQPNFKGADWDVVVQPTKSKIQEFTAKANFYSSFETFFLAKTVKDELRFYIGDENSTNHKGFIIFEKPVEGELDNNLYWPISQVLQVLKLGQEGNTAMSFTQKGALMITMISPYGTWDFILPAKKR